MMSCQRQLADGSVRTVLAACQTLRTLISICLHLVVLVPRSVESETLKGCRKPEPQQKNGQSESPCGSSVPIDGGYREFWDLQFVFSSYDSESKFHSDHCPPNDNKSKNHQRNLEPA